MKATKFGLRSLQRIVGLRLGSGIGGQVSVRYPNKPFFYMHLFERTFEEMQVEDIILFNFDGKAVSSNRSPSQGIEFHHGIYKQREDVPAIVHSHGFWITAQAAFAHPPHILNHVSTVFYERTAVSPNDNFASISQSLGSDDIAIVIPRHGAITLGSTLGEAESSHVVFDCTARMDVTLPTSAPTMPIEQCSSLSGMV